MRESGQTHLEAIICFMVFLAILGSFLGVMGKLGRGAENATDSMKAEVSAQKCAIISNSLYANGGGRIENLELVCFLKEKNWVGSVLNESNKKAFVIPNEIKFIQSEGKTTLWVEVNEHYK